MQFQHKIDFRSREKLPYCMALYGVFSNEKLLYIGASWNLKNRFIAHHKMAEFYENEANLICYNVYNDIEELYDEEHKFITTYKPLLNVNHQRRKTKRTSAEKEDIKLNNEKLIEIRWEAFKIRSVLHKIVFELAWEYVLSSKTRNVAINTIINNTGLSPSWVRNFLDNPENSASVDRIEAIYEFLTGDNLLDLIDSKKYKDEVKFRPAYRTDNFFKSYPNKGKKK